MPHKLYVAGILVVLGSFAASCPGQDATDRPGEADVPSAAKGNNEFAFDLYRQLAKQAKANEKLFFSPYSISAALAMTYAGARGETAEEMAKVLRFNPDQERFHPAFAELTRQVRQPGKDFKGEIGIANAIWVDKAVKVREPFRRL